jgi:hypothetical protein
MSIGAFRKWPIDKRPKKINNIGKIYRGASEARIITYLMPLEWNEEKILYPVSKSEHTTEHGN